MAKNIEKYSKEDLIALIESIERVTKLDREAISLRSGRNKGYLSQVISRGHVPPKLVQTLKNEFKDELKAQLSGNIQATSTFTGILTARNFKEEFYSALEDLRKKDNQLTEIKESLDKLALAVDRLGASKEMISGSVSFCQDSYQYFVKEDKEYRAISGNWGKASERSL